MLLDENRELKEWVDKRIGSVNEVMDDAERLIKEAGDELRRTKQLYNQLKEEAGLKEEIEELRKEIEELKQPKKRKVRFV